MRPSSASQRCAVRIMTAASQHYPLGVEVIAPDGSHQTLVADRFVLAATAIEDARLLLLSDPGGPGIGNSSGAVFKGAR